LIADDGDVHKATEQPDLAPEDLVYGSRVDLGAIRDSGQGRGDVSMIGEQRRRSIDDPPFGLLCVCSPDWTVTSAAGWTLG
jgi:hypothetical protein